MSRGILRKVLGPVNDIGTEWMLTPQEVIPEMGTVSRETPRNLARKLLKIRKMIDGGISQEEMVKRLGLSRKKNFNRTYISKYEQGVLEPPLKVLLAYARLISSTGRGEFLEALIDDALDIPDKMPASSVTKVAAQKHKV